MDYLRLSLLPVDGIWMGLFLHHFSRPLKRELFSLAHRRLRAGGCVLAHDPLPRKRENRAKYLERLERTGRRQWRALSPANLRVLHRHWTQHGRQERFAVLTRLARQAGFSECALLFRDEQELYALTLFAADSAGRAGK